MNDVKIRFQLVTKHADGIEHAILAVDVIVLNNGMEKRVLRRNAHFARIDLHVVNVLFIDFIMVVRQNDAATVVETLNVRAGHADINTLDHHVAFRFGVA